MKITGWHIVTWDTRLLHHMWCCTKQPIHTLLAAGCTRVVGAADTWLGYISALVTKRHEPRGGNHGSRDFCQWCSLVIAEELGCNLKHISEQITLSAMDRDGGLLWPNPLKSQAVVIKWTWIQPNNDWTFLQMLVLLRGKSFTGWFYHC